MALPTTATIDNLTRCLRLPGIFPGKSTEQFLRKLPFERIDGYGRQVEINRVSSLGASVAYDPGDSIDLSATAAETVSFAFARIGGTAEVDSADICASGEDNNQLQLQIEMKKVAIVRELARQVTIGNGSPPNLAGLVAFVNGSQEIDKTGSAPTLADFHRLISLVEPSDGFLGAGPDALVMNSNARRTLISLIEAVGCEPTFVFDDELGVPVLLFDGLPVYLSDTIPLAGVGSNETTIFALKLSGATGVRVLHTCGDSSEYGISVDEVPPQLSESKRAATVRGYYCLLVPEVASVAGIVNAAVLIP